MLTVRFPTGVALTYNDAHDVEYNTFSKRFQLLNKKGEWVAVLTESTGCIIEADAPCSIKIPYNDFRAELRKLNRAIAELKPKTKKGK